MPALLPCYNSTTQHVYYVLTCWNSPVSLSVLISYQVQSAHTMLPYRQVFHHRLMNVTKIFLSILILTIVGKNPDWENVETLHATIVADLFLFLSSLHFCFTTVYNFTSKLPFLLLAVVVPSWPFSELCALACMQFHGRVSSCWERHRLWLFLTYSS